MTALPFLWNCVLIQSYNPEYASWIWCFFRNIVVTLYLPLIYLPLIGSQWSQQQQETWVKKTWSAQTPHANDHVTWMILLAKKKAFVYNMCQAGGLYFPILFNTMYDCTHV